MSSGYNNIHAGLASEAGDEYRPSMYDVEYTLRLAASYSRATTLKCLTLKGDVGEGRV